ncbi:putative cytochrome P450 [Helianthus anomalus]
MNCYPGKQFIYWSGNEPRMTLLEPHLIKEFLGKHNYNLGRSLQQLQGSKDLTGRGVIMAEGHDWNHQRKVVAGAFVNQKLKTYAPKMVECTKQMIQSMEKEVTTGKKEFKIDDYITELTGNIISQTGFNTTNDKGKQILDLLTRLQSLSAKASASRFLFIPGARFLWTKYDKEIKSLKMEVYVLLKEIIQQRQTDGAGSYGSDLLGLLLNDMHSNRGGNGSSSNLELVIDECKTFFFGGHETTAMLITWTIMLLAINTSWQNKVRSEVRRVCKDGSPSFDDLARLSVLKDVINESLRLYPPAPILLRRVLEDMKLGDLELPKGLCVWIPVLAIHHSKEIWGEDVNEFKPDRFAQLKGYEGSFFLPFGGGPRNCVGRAFAIDEAKIILAMLISKFQFTISDSYKHAPVTLITLKPKYGVQVWLQPLV